MATLYGGAMPDDFVSGEELTATEFNKVKNYWIVDGDLPEGPEINDGDVVFVLGDEVGTPEAEISAITGSGVTHTYGDFIAYEFLTSGSLTCTEGTFPEALIIGGGGSGGASNSGAGGGGAGGHLEITNLYLPSGTASCVIGDGGVATSPAAGGSVDTMGGKTGLPSSVNGQYYSPGGGSGNTNLFTYNFTASYSQSGNNGASGGGGAYATSGAQAPNLAGGLGVSGLGFAGGDANSSGHGAGGGAGSAGGNGVVAPGATGGAGKESSITGVAVTRAGGGGAFVGGSGGSGGGGDGGSPIADGGDANTGSGGGGGGNTSGAGGSGVIIIKVLASNASNVDKSGWTEVTALMLAEAKKKRELERKAQQAAIVLEKKNEELSGATQMDIEGDLI